MTDTHADQPPHPEPVGSVPEGREGSGALRLALLIGALVLFTWKFGWWGLVVVLGLIVMITLHELGHYLVAKRSGMKVTEFFLGFGPRIWSFRRGETEYGIKALPFGAYVRIVGMSSMEEVEPADEPRTYRSKPFWQRFGVAVAGSAMHGLQALVIVYLLLAVVGVRGGTALGAPAEDPGWTISRVIEDCPAGRAGLQRGDRILSVAGHPTPHWEDMTSVVGDNPGEVVPVVVERDGERFTRDVRLVSRHSHGEVVGGIGISPRYDREPIERVGPLEAIPQTLSETGSTLVASLQGLGHFVRPSTLREFSRQVANAPEDRARTQRESATTVPPESTTPPTTTATPPADDHDLTEEDKACEAALNAPGSSDESDPTARLTSIIGIFQIGKSAGQLDGFRAVLAILAMINIFIGVFNLLPFPILDGGHVVVAVYEKVQEWRLGLKTRYLADMTKVLPFAYAFLLVLGVLAVSTVYLDIVNPLSLN